MRKHAIPADRKFDHKTGVNFDKNVGNKRSRKRKATDAETGAEDKTEV